MNVHLLLKWPLIRWPSAGLSSAVRAEKLWASPEHPVPTPQRGRGTPAGLSQPSVSHGSRRPALPPSEQPTPAGSHRPSSLRARDGETQGCSGDSAGRGRKLPEKGCGSSLENEDSGYVTLGELHDLSER